MSDHSCKTAVQTPVQLTPEILSNVTVLGHPLIQTKLTRIRDEKTNSPTFRKTVMELTPLLLYEATSDLPLQTVTVKTPICPTNAKTLAGHTPAFVPILRAGTGMLDGALSLVSEAKVGHIGLFRDEGEKQAEGSAPKIVKYYNKLPPDIEKRPVYVLDPMLATGGSANVALDTLKEAGCSKIKFICIIAAPEGIKAVYEEHPDVKIFTCAIDERLNENFYIVPGLGDAGDRIFGTK